MSDITKPTANATARNRYRQSRQDQIFLVQKSEPNQF